MSQSHRPLAPPLRPARSSRTRDRLRSACILLPLAAAACSGGDRSGLADDSTSHGPTATESSTTHGPAVMELPLETSSVEASSVYPERDDTMQVVGERIHLRVAKAGERAHLGVAPEGDAEASAQAEPEPSERVRARRVLGSRGQRPEQQARRRRNERAERPHGEPLEDAPGTVTCTP